MNSLKFLLNLNSPDLQPDITVNVMGKSWFYTVINTCVCNLKMADEDNHTYWPLKESLKKQGHEPFKWMQATEISKT